jgi:hypothetical protein
MENHALFFEPIIEKAERYSQTTFHILKLKATSKIAEVASIFILKTLIYFPLTISFVLFSIGLSLYLGELTGSAYKGFLFTGGIYLIPSLFIYLFRNKFLKRKIQNMIIQEILAQPNEL